jgi:GntR family transcriptional regulator
MLTGMTTTRLGPRAARRSDDARRVRDLLRSELTRGGFAGRRLPAEEQLMNDFGVSRSAVREALALLRHEGLIDRLQGIGTVDVHHKIVSDLPETHGVIEPRPGSMWSGQMRVHVLDWSEVALPEIAAAALDVAIGSPALRVDYLGMLDGHVLGVATNYVSSPAAPRLRREDFRTDWYALLDAAHLTVGESTWLMEAAIADAHDADLLGVVIGAPIMIAEQVIYDETGKAFDFAVTRGRGDRLAYFSRARRKPA